MKYLVYNNKVIDPDGMDYDEQVFDVLKELCSDVEKLRNDMVRVADHLNKATKAADRNFDNIKQAIEG